MRESLIAQRSARAQAQIIEAVTNLAAGADIDASGLAVTSRDPAVQEMMRWEALAALLASLPAPSVAEAKPEAAEAKPTKRGAKVDET